MAMSHTPKKIRTAARLPSHGDYDDEMRSCHIEHMHKETQTLFKDDQCRGGHNLDSVCSRARGEQDTGLPAFVLR